MSEGTLNAAGQKHAIIASRFNKPIIDKLLNSALETFKRHGAESCKVFWVPGSFELPLIAKKVAETKKYDSVICLGCVIRGETAHFEHVATQAASGILQSSLETGIPIIFGVLTTENVQQAESRINTGSKGALAAIEMVNLIKAL